MALSRIRYPNKLIGRMAQLALFKYRYRSWIFVYFNTTLFIELVGGFDWSEGLFGQYLTILCLAATYRTTVYLRTVYSETVYLGTISLVAVYLVTVYLVTVCSTARSGLVDSESVAAEGWKYSYICCASIGPIPLTAASCLGEASRM